MEKVIFREDQKFGSMSLYLSMGVIYLGTILLFIYAFYCQFVLNEPIGDKPISDKGLILSAFLVLVVFLLSGFFLFGSRLNVIITNSNITLTFKPILNKAIVLTKNEIQNYEIREYKPIKEFGGWGVKVGKRKVGKAYNVHGNIGLQLYLKDGVKILIGTQRRDAIFRAMKKMMENN